MIRSTVSARWLEADVQRLYEFATPQAVEALSEEAARDWLDALQQFDTQLEKIVQAIPFERKLGAMMRPFRERFQAIIRLRGAVRTCRALLQQRLEPCPPRTLQRGKLSYADLSDARDRISREVPGWASKEMDLYDYV